MTRRYPERRGLTLVRSYLRESVLRSDRPLAVADVVHELVSTDRALAKLAARNISFREAMQLPGNRHVIGRNPRNLRAGGS